MGGWVDGWGASSIHLSNNPFIPAGPAWDASGATNPTQAPKYSATYPARASQPKIGKPVAGISNNQESETSQNTSPLTQPIRKPAPPDLPWAAASISAGAIQANPARLNFGKASASTPPAPAASSQVRWRIRSW